MRRRADTIYLALTIVVGSILELSKMASPRLVLPASAALLIMWGAQQTLNATVAPPEPYPSLLKVVPYHWRLCAGPANDPISCSE